MNGNTVRMRRSAILRFTSRFSIITFILTQVSKESVGLIDMKGKRSDGKRPFEISPANKRELRELSMLLGTPIGNAKTAKAVVGVPSRTTYHPRCPESLQTVVKEKHNYFITLCPNLRDQEYNKHANRVASIVNGYKETHSEKYMEQKRALIAAVNDMARMAGAVPSLNKKK